MMFKRYPTCDVRRLAEDCRASVTLIFAVAMVAILATIGVSINMAELADLRAALQRAADNAALSGAAAYSENSAAFNVLAIQTATTGFCNSTATLPLGALVVNQPGAQPCGNLPGPMVTAVTDSYITGTPGVSHANGVSCTGTYLPGAPYNCGFVVTVKASATLHPIIPSLFGSVATVSVSGVAANPFISFAKVFTFPNGMGGSAKYANSIWAYALALNAQGGVDYSSNAGGLPDSSSCTDDPDEVTCGAYVMLGSTMYDLKGMGYTATVNGVSTTYDNGIVRNPASPTQITATTPIGIAFKSIAGGNYVQYSPPGVYGYNVLPLTLGLNPAVYQYAASGCIYPYSHLAYNTVTQVWTSQTAVVNGVSTTSYTHVLPWSTVTHWFYSSYLTNTLPPSQGEIVAQASTPEIIPSVGLDTAQAGGNIGGASTYNANPIPAVATNCPKTTNLAGLQISNSLSQTTTYLTTGNDNCSLYVTQSSTAGAVTPNPAYVGSCFDPSNTPGRSFAALSCQAYGSYIYTFFWNDMGGAINDDENYGNGIVQISCASAAHVVLIQ